MTNCENHISVDVNAEFNFKLGQTSKLSCKCSKSEMFISTSVSFLPSLLLCNIQIQQSDISLKVHLLFHSFSWWPTNSVHSKLVHESGLSDGFKVGSTHHGVHTLLHECSHTQLLCDLHCETAQTFVIAAWHSWETRAKPVNDSKQTKIKQLEMWQVCCCHDNRDNSELHHNMISVK